MYYFWHLFHYYQDNLFYYTKKKEKQLDEIKKNYMDMINMKEEKIKQLKEKLGY